MHSTIEDNMDEACDSIGEDSKACRYCWHSLMEMHDLEYLGVNGRKILSLI
jgi:hypothetical protein